MDLYVTWNLEVLHISPEQRDQLVAAGLIYEVDPDGTEDMPGAYYPCDASDRIAEDVTMDDIEAFLRDSHQRDE